MNIITNHLADHAVEDYEPLKFDFFDKDVLSVEEGDSNWCCGNGVGAMLISPDKKHYPVLVKS